MQEKSYARTFRIIESRGWFILILDGNHIIITCHFSSDRMESSLEKNLRERIRLMFDLGRDFVPIEKKLRMDSLLQKGMINGQIPRLPSAFDVYEFMVRAILGQQITVKAATTLASRIAERAAIFAGLKGSPEFYFPQPEELISLDLEGLGITKTRQDTLRRVTEAILEGKLSLERNQVYEDFHRNFTALKGIGDWSASYVAMRGLGLINSFPSSDLGVIKAMSRGGDKITQKAILERARGWEPYRAYGALCLWNSL